MDADGNSQIMELRCDVVRNRKGQLSEMVMIYHRLGDRHLLEENLRFSEQRLTSILKIFPTRCGSKTVKVISLPRINPANAFLASNRMN